MFSIVGEATRIMNQNTILKCPTCRNNIFKLYNFECAKVQGKFLGIECTSCWECYNFSENGPIKNIFFRPNGQINETAEGLNDIIPSPDIFMKSPENDNEEFNICYENELIIIRGINNRSIRSFNPDEQIKSILDYFKI